MHGPVDGFFGVLDLFDTFVADLGQPLFEGVTNCNGLISFIGETLFQDAPTYLRITAISQHSNHIDYRKKPFLLFGVPLAPNLSGFE
jgi:hypothetical protein